MINRLPATATSFIGRAAELVQIEQLLAAPAGRLLTLLGPGGIGKTRLALEAARRLNFPHGVHFVPFQPLTSPAFMVSAIADSIGFHFYVGADPNQQLLDYLREKSLLLVLDNLEHLLDGVLLLSEILTAAPEVRILATSRERLNLREEWVLDVDGLAYPSDEHEANLEHYSAVELFMQHARRIKASFRLNEVQSPAIVRICRLVGGMPLGIELAASWVRALSCEAIAEEIAQSLDILETPRRNVEPRHRNMRAAFAPTWGRLSEEERSVFRRLSVFRGGFTREAAEQIAGATLLSLSALVDKSLLRVDVSGRYDLHELLRQYAEEKLGEAPAEQEQTQDRHCAYYADFMGQWVDDPAQVARKETAAKILIEIKNVRTAFQCAVDGHKLDEMNKLLPTLVPFYDFQNWYYEGQETFRLAAESLRSSFDKTSEQETRLLALSLTWQAWFLRTLLRLEEAKRLAWESLDMLLPLGSGRELAGAYIVLSHLVKGDAEGKRLCQEALKHAQAVAYHWGIMLSKGNLSLFAGNLGQYDEALRLAEELLGLCRARNFQYGEAWAFQRLADVAFAHQNYSEAKQWVQKALAVAQSIGNREGTAFHHTVLGDIAYKTGNYFEAQRHHQESLMLYQELGNQLHIALCHMNLGSVATRLSNGHEARKHFHEVLRIMQDTQLTDWLLGAALGIAELMMVEGNTERAVELLVHPLQHPRTTEKIQYWAERLRSELEAALAPEVYAAAWERGTKLELNTLVAELMSELSQSVEIPESAISPTITPSLNLLTEREREILHLIADGFSNREIAEKLVLGVSTIKWYINKIFSKLHVTTRTQALAHARTLGLLS